MPAEDEEIWMKWALRLAARGRGRTSPNPMVGAVIVRHDDVVGTGWHRKAGAGHAEAVALAQAGSRAKGSTMYVTLEPCAHHGRTPPCVDAIIDAGVSRVVAAIEDPDPLVSGAGAAALREAGVEVEFGLLSKAATTLNEEYLVHRREGRPFVTLKMATSFDGRVAAADGSSQWITCEESRRDAHRLRAQSDAICAGIGTVLADDPRLTVREVQVAAPRLRVVVDSTARTPIDSRILSEDAPTLIATALPPDDERVSVLKKAGAEVLSMAGPDRRVSILHLLHALAGRSVISLLLEGGPRLAGCFAAQGMIDRYVFYMAPKLLGERARGSVEGWTAESIDESRDLRITEFKRLGSDLKVIAYPVPPEPAG
ncbi:MAG: bifunctional diaminohydroxyphosphoribosylaminopyrimidine deaminase/5-amino-6-(5-phosphoribosylamino)uracil reductase RibD [Actinomycetota bacterium]